MEPTLAGYISFIRSIMNVPVEALPDDSDYIVMSYNWAMDYVLLELQTVPHMTTSPRNMYAVAVYNCAADMLVNIAVDDPNAPPPFDTYWSDLRSKLGINNFVPGMVTSSSDQGTSTSLTLPDFFKNLTLGDLQQMKTPWGRMYLQIAQSWGTVWGIS
jgi:hypothetical protein